MKRWAGAIPEGKPRRPSGQSIIWFCKSCEKGTIAQMPENDSESIRCPTCDAPKDARD